MIYGKVMLLISTVKFTECIRFLRDKKEYKIEENNSDDGIKASKIKTRKIWHLKGSDRTLYVFSVFKCGNE